jgi:hypothetical protein
MFLRFLARIVCNQTTILKELYEMSVTFDALATAVDNAVAKLGTIAATQAELTQAKADLTAAQAKVDELTAKLQAATV